MNFKEMFNFNPNGFELPYYFVHLVCRLIVYVFYRKVHAVCLDHMPKEGPVILCGTHSNQYMDAIMIVANSPRTVHFIIAAVSWNKPTIGFFLDMMPLIKTKRPQDYATPGTGQIVSIVGDIMTGSGTKFVSTLQVKDAVYITNTKKTFPIVKVLDDERLQIANRDNIHFENATENFKNQPRLDQSLVYKNTFKVLEEGKVIGIFPEGGSHDQAGLLPLKAGAVIMALGAKDKLGINPKIITAGLNYYKPHKFRSTAVVEFGDGFSPSDEQLTQYRQGGLQKRAVISEMLDTLQERMSDVRMTASSYKELMAFYTARSLLTIGMDTNATEEEKSELFRSLKECFRKGEETNDSEVLLESLTAYRRDLKNMGIGDWQLQKLDASIFDSVGQLIHSFVFIILSLTIALPALIFTIPQRMLLQYWGEQAREKNLKKSSVKITGNDTVATYKVLMGIPMSIVSSNLMNLVYLFFISGRFFDSFICRLLTVPIFAVLFTSYLVLTVRFNNGLNTHIKIFMIRIIAVVYRGRVNELSKRRESLKTRVNEFMKKYTRLMVHSYENEKKLSMKRSESIRQLDTEEIFNVLEEIF